MSVSIYNLLRQVYEMKNILQDYLSTMRKIIDWELTKPGVVKRLSKCFDVSTKLIVKIYELHTVLLDIQHTLEKVVK